jgi:hypothetical protein
MPTIDQLSQAGSIDDADEVALFSKANGTTRKVSGSQLAAYVLAAIEGTPDDTVYSLSAAGGFTVTALPAAPGAGVWAQITLTTAAPAGTVILPGIDDRAHGQEVLVTMHADRDRADRQRRRRGAVWRADHGGSERPSA